MVNHAIYHRVLEDETWKERARCNPNHPDAKPTEFFYPDRSGHDAQIMAFCGRCPVRDACLEFALRTRDAFGHWGGISERERRRILKRRRRGMTR